jgi:D-alanyl-D-alanine carboxypeptidase
MDKNERVNRGSRAFGRRLPLARMALASAALAVALVAVPGGGGGRVAAIGQLPECRLADILTVPRDYDSWSTTLVDWLLSVGKDYVPPDLVSVRKAGLTGSGYVRSIVIDDLRALGDAAKKNGTPVGSWSAYRSYQQQVDLFNGYVKAYGYDNAKEFSQRPGHSEHQLGLVIDFMASGANGMLSGTSATGKWMAANAWKYGWVLSYPPSKIDPSHLWNETVCFRYEPWHYRYVGRDIAKKIHDSGLTVREYLWANYTQVDPTTGEALPSPTVETSPTATASATSSASATAPSGALVSPMGTPTNPAAPSGATPSLGTWLLVAVLVVAGGGLLALAGLGFGGRRGLLRRGAYRR